MSVPSRLCIVIAYQGIKDSRPVMLPTGCSLAYTKSLWVTTFVPLCLR